MKKHYIKNFVDMDAINKGRFTQHIKNLSIINQRNSQ